MLKMIDRMNSLTVGLFLMMCFVLPAHAGEADRITAWSPKDANPVQMRPGLGIAAGQAPISKALLAIVPPPYEIRLADSIDPGTVLQWGAAADWYTGLRNALEPHGMKVSADWDANVVTISAASSRGLNSGKVQASQPVVAPLNAALNAGGASGQIANQVQDVRTSAANVAAAGKWDVRSNDVNLETTFKRWAQQGGYQLLWDTDSQVLIPASDSFTGSLLDAIDRVLASPAIRNSGNPLEAVIYANNPPLIRITRLGEQPAQE